VILRRIAIVLLVAAAAAGCGSSVSAKEQVKACVDKYPDATQADCQEWQKDGQLEDDGTHQGHENMG
jgi:hypothetical protein